MKSIIRYWLFKILTIASILPVHGIIYAQTTRMVRSAAMPLSLAGIQNMEQATEKLNNIIYYVNNEGPKLIVHLVNWYRYDSEDVDKIMGWNGTGKDKGTISLTSKPLFGYYSCNDTLYMDWVLGFSKALGIDELNIDYEGGVDYPEEFETYYRDRSWDSWFLDLLNRAENYNIRISVMYEPKSIAWRLAKRQGNDGPVLTTDSTYAYEALKLLKSDLKLICDRFTIKKDENDELIPNPAYKRLAGLPVIWVFGMTAGSLTESIWKQAIDDLYNEGYTFVLVATTYPENQSCFDSIIQGLNPWLDQLFTGFQSQYRELWNVAQKAAETGDREKARNIANQYISEVASRGLNVVAPIREVKGLAHFNITPLAIGFQDADVDAWGFRPPVFIESNDRTFTEPGKLFRAYFSAAQKSKNPWYLICSGDDMAEHTHMLIPDIEYGFSGPYAIGLISAYLGKNPDIQQAIQITEDFVRIQNKGYIPEYILPIITEANEILPDQLKSEIGSFAN